MSEAAVSGGVCQSKELILSATLSHGGRSKLGVGGKGTQRRGGGGGGGDGGGVREQETVSE